MGFETFGSAKFRYWTAIIFSIFSAAVLSGLFTSGIFVADTELLNISGLTVGKVLAITGLAVAYWIYKNAV